MRLFSPVPCSSDVMSRGTIISLDVVGYMAWLKEEGFGGIMVWSVVMEDFRGACGTGKFPLMNAMGQELDGYTVKS
ncbi:endochitinase-like [Lycorma delicatula]|uniref:endochitinase-like n=1 Tax=Lycorma delicatula TaxID=130591 RepID=UPI003F517904